MKEIEILKKAVETADTYCTVDSGVLIAVCGKLPNNKTAAKILAIASRSKPHGGRSMSIPTAFAKEFLAEVTGGPLKQ